MLRLTSNVDLGCLSVTCSLSFSFDMVHRKDVRHTPHCTHRGCTENQV
jgi:hypothetical protein